ncbi:MAG: hypothetical protein KF715_21725 [Candidatus Didemnitutus sp.]|nr:hypothetical protein [Candidatus Didemnitutus sp.]
MKTHPLLPLLCLGLTVLPAAAPAQDPSPPALAPVAAETGLRFNFRGAPLETVLNYLSDAAGYVIVLETPVRGTVDMWSSQPVSKEEAVQLLNLALNKNGYTARVQGRNLIVSSKEDAKKTNLPIRTGNDPAEIPETADMVMQIIPLRHIDATQAARDLGTLLPATATLTANQDSNSLVVTDTQINVKHVVEIVAALDGSIDSAATVRVFPLKNADPYEMAQLLTNLFGTTATPTANAAATPGGPGGFFARMAAAGGFGGGGNSGSRRNGSTGTGRTTPVVAVADPRTFSVVVTASKAQMGDVAAMIAQLDTSSGRKQRVFVYTLQNADVKQVETILKNLFQSNTTRTTANSNQADPLGTRANNNSQTTSANPSLTLGNSTGNRGR